MLADIIFQMQGEDFVCQIRLVFVPPVPLPDDKIQLVGMLSSTSWKNKTKQLFVYLHVIIIIFFFPTPRFVKLAVFLSCEIPDVCKISYTDNCDLQRELRRCQSIKIVLSKSVKVIWKECALIKEGNWSTRLFGFQIFDYLGFKHWPSGC